MVLKVLCVGITPELWGKDKPVHEQRIVSRLNLVDMDEFCQVRETFDYVPTKEEEQTIDPGRLKMVTFSLGVSMWMKEDGRLKATRGKIDLGTVPAAAKRSVQEYPVKERDNGKTVLGNTSAAKPVAA